MLVLRTFGGLWVESEDGSRRQTVRPRRLALLALLAAAGTKGRSRDQILAILWPDSPPERARAALSQTLYSLHGDLDVDVMVATTAELRLDPARLSSDIDAFRKATSARDWLRAGSLYSGPFLDGFYLHDAPEFERWVDEERAALAREGARAIEHVARAAGEGGRLEEAAELWERLARIDPLNSGYAAGYMEALARIGDRAGALAHGQAHAERVRQELETDPDVMVLRLLTTLRDRGAGRRADPSGFGSSAGRPAAGAVAQVDGAPVPSPAGPLGAGRSRRLAAAIAALAVLALAIFAWRGTRRPPATSEGPVLAVGQVRDLVTPDSLQLGGVLSEMLATSIGRLTQLQVIANSRLLELIPPGGETVRSARTEAARRAGATQVLEGELIPLTGAQLRFQVRRLDLPRGMVRAGYQIDGSDRIALFDSVAVLVAADLGVAPPKRSLADASTRSPIAYRLYEEGLRALTLHEADAARRLFSAAVQEDSTFAMATYYLWRSEIALNLAAQYGSAERALRLASRAADRDRLLILTHVLAARSDPAALSVADSLVMRFPNDPEALVKAAAAVVDAARTIALLNAAIALDSAAGAEASAYCRLCEAFEQLALQYSWLDSATAIERTVRRWMRFRPADPDPWTFLSDHLISVGRRAEADTAMQRAIALGAPRPDEVIMGLISGLRTDAAAASDVCRMDRAAPSGSNRGFYRWYCMIALRTRGRFREAMALATTDPPDEVNAAILALNLGQPILAARRFLRLARQAEREYAASPGLLARNVTWNLTLAGTAFVEGGDTLSARRLVDSVEATGHRSLFPRDPLLHRFLRGLLLAREGLHDSAAQEFRAAMLAPSLGFTRINYELGKSLLALNRAPEAIPVLRAPLRGGLDGAGLYLTRTETHELLARAFEAAGEQDSAAAHYAIVERAWRDADPILKPRYAATRARLAALGVQPLRN